MSYGEPLLPGVSIILFVLWPIGIYTLAVGILLNPFFEYENDKHSKARLLT